MTNQTTPEPLLTPSDVGRLLGVGKTTVYELMASGELPYIQVAQRGRRIAREALAAFIESRTVNANRPAA